MIHGLTYNLDGQGLETIFRSWQIEVFETLWKNPELSSRQVFDDVSRVLIASDGGTISRASVINFLNDMVNQKFLDYREISGKGGYKRIYRVNDKSRDEETFRVTLARLIMRHVSHEIIDMKFTWDDE